MDTTILKEAMELKEEMTAIRRHLHQNPELSGQEWETGKYICSKLDEWGIPYEYGVAETGIVAVITGRDTSDGIDMDYSSSVLKDQSDGKGRAVKCVALRADMDALPMTEATGLAFASCREGIAHTCGHDGHVAAALGAARILNRRKDSFSGSVKLFFQPAEETTGGAERMIQAGCLEKPHVDYVLGLHMDPSLACGEVEFKHGKMMAASDEFTILLTGQGCHGAHPERGCDAIAMAAQVVTSLQTVVSRNIAPVNSAVVSVGMIHAGTAGNAIAQTAELTGIMRCLDPETRDLLKERVRQIVENTAAAFGGRGQLILRPSYSPLINNDGVVDLMMDTAASLIGKDHIHQMPCPDMGTEDFSFFAMERPSCFWHLGCGNPEKGITQDIHNPGFDLDEDCLPIGAAIQAAGVLELLAL